MGPRRRGTFAALVLVAAAAAQAEERSALEQCFPSGVPRFAVVAFCRDVGEASLEVEWLRKVQERHAGAGVRCAVVLAESPRESDGKLLAGLGVGVEVVPNLRQRAVGDGERGLVALFAEGSPVGAGSPAHGFAAAVASLVAGRHDDGRALEAHRSWVQVREEYADLLAKESVQRLAREVQRHPWDGCRRGLLFLCQWQKAGDRAAAQQTAVDAARELAEDPRAYAAFADLALRSTGRDAVFARSLLEPLAKAAEASGGDVRVQLARLRALVQADEGREVGRLAHGLARRATATPASALQFAEILSSASEPAVHLELCTRALAAARSGEADARFLRAVGHAVAARCEGDAHKARELATEAAEHEPGRVSVNNEIWRWLVGVEELGRFDGFAMALTERLLEQRAALEFFECDTAAFAMARAGRFREAVELQQLAIDRGGDLPIYRERLETYEQAVKPAAPR